LAPYLSTLSSGVLLQSVAEAECRRAAFEAEERYRDSFKVGDLPPEEEALFIEHQVGGGDEEPLAELF
jgi:hypothetical protein